MSIIPTQYAIHITSESLCVCAQDTNRPQQKSTHVVSTHTATKTSTTGKRERERAHARTQHSVPVQVRLPARVPPGHVKIPSPAVAVYPVAHVSVHVPPETRLAHVVGFAPATLGKEVHTSPEHTKTQSPKAKSHHSP